MKNIIIILAGQRTGSTGLGRGLAQLLDYQWLGEIFHSDFADPATDLDLESNINKRANFFNYRYHRCQGDPTLTFPSKKNQEQLFQGYMDFILDRFNNNGVIVDIKYTSLHHLDTYWLWPNSIPFLLKLIRQAEIPVVHVVRENLFAQYCSYQLAVKNNFWHRRPGEDQPEGTLTLDVKDAERFMNVMRSWTAHVQGWLVDYKPYHTLKYEEIFEGDFLSKEVVQIFGDTVSSKLNRQAPVPTRKVTPPLGEVVDNIGGVLEHFKETEYDEMVRKSLTI